MVAQEPASTSRLPRITFLSSKIRRHLQPSLSAPLARDVAWFTHGSFAQKPASTNQEALVRLFVVVIAENLNGEFLSIPLL